MVRIISVSEIYFGGRQVSINAGCDGIPCSENTSNHFPEPSNDELERIEKEGKEEGLSQESFKSAFQNLLISNTFKIK